MEKPKISPLATPKPLTKLAGVITSRMALDVQKFVAIGSGFLLPKYVSLPCLMGD